MKATIKVVPIEVTGLDDDLQVARLGYSTDHGTQGPHGAHYATIDVLEDVLGELKEMLHAAGYKTIRVLDKDGAEHAPYFLEQTLTPVDGDYFAARERYEEEGK